MAAAPLVPAPPPIAPAAALSAPSAEPSPGNEVTAAGTPPAGATTSWPGPPVRLRAASRSAIACRCTGGEPAIPGTSPRTRTWGAGLLSALEMVAAGTVTSNRVSAGEPSFFR